jgi:PAS domain S-box-containing protein
MDDEVILVHPITPYRSYRPGDVVANRCVLMGIPDVIQDSASLLVALAALCKHGIHEAERKLKVQVRFNIDDEALHFSTNGLMCPFEMRSVNLSALGLRNEVSKNGCLKAQFGEDGRLKQLELFFDPISFWRQMQQAGKQDIRELDDLLVTPNTLDAALADSNEARVVTEAVRPFRITHVNEAWSDLCGFTADEACGQTLRCLQGQDTDATTVAQLVEDCTDNKPTSMEVTNYDKEGKKFKNFLQVYPLTSNEGEGEISHLLGVLKPLSEKY